MPTLEELKKAQQQLSEGEEETELKTSEKASPPFNVSRAVSEMNSRAPQKLKDWITLQDWYKDLITEKQKLRGLHKELENQQRKIQERLGIIEELESQSQRISKELEELQQKIVLVRKESNSVWFQIKPH